MSRHLLHIVYIHLDKMQTMQLGCIFSTLSSSSVYSLSWTTMDGSKFVCGIDIGIIAQLMHIDEFAHVAFVGHICCWHIYGTSMLNKCVILLFLTDMCSNVGCIFRLQ